MFTPDFYQPLLLKYGMDVHQKSQDQEICRWAEEEGNYELVKYVLDHPNVNIGAKFETEEGLISKAELATAVLRMCISDKGNPDSILYAISNGADIYYDAQRALRDASTGGLHEALKILIEKGTWDKAVIDSSLRSASMRGYIECMSLLLELGADPYGKNSYVSPICDAVGSNQLQAVKYFHSLGYSLLCHDELLLRVASVAGHTEIVKYLVEHGLNIYSDDSRALKLAAEEDEIETVLYFLIDCNMEVDSATVEWLKDKSCHETLKILDKRKLNKNLLSSLKPKLENTSSKKNKI